MLEPADPPRTFTEDAWNKFSIREVEQKGREADPEHKYRASKVLAEKAAWQFMDDHPELNWGLTTISAPAPSSCLHHPHSGYSRV